MKFGYSMKIFEKFINLTLVWPLMILISTPVTRAADVQVLYDSTLPVCVLVHSQGVVGEMVSTVSAVLQEVVKVECKAEEAPVLNSFQALQEKESTLNSYVLLFSLEKSTRDEVYVLRGLEVDSRLQWGMVNFKISGLSAPTSRTILTEAVRKLLRQFPFIGYVEEGKFFAWEVHPTRKYSLVQRKEDQRHPFNAILLKPNYVRLVEKGSSLQKISETEYRLEFKDLKDSLTKEKRLWLVFSDR